MSSWYREGYDKAMREARVASVLDVLDARGLPVSEEQRARILGCSDLELKLWLRRAALVNRADEIFT